MRKIALDVGDKTIGVAVSDELMLTAQGVTTIERIGIRKDCGRVIDYIKEYCCDTVVVGLPLKLDGTDSPQTKRFVNLQKCSLTKCAAPEWQISKSYFKTSALQQ